MSFRSGFVSIIGRPNAGKSTLLNKLVGEKVAIVTPKPQTTRNRILGMVNVPARKGRPAGQIVLIDTPGVHKPANSLNKKMMREVHAALESRDAILLIVDATQTLRPRRPLHPRPGQEGGRDGVPAAEQDRPSGESAPAAHDRRIQPSSTTSARSSPSLP